MTGPAVPQLTCHGATTPQPSRCTRRHGPETRCFNSTRNAPWCHRGKKQAPPHKKPGFRSIVLLCFWPYLHDYRNDGWLTPVRCDREERGDLRPQGQSPLCDLRPIVGSLEGPQELGGEKWRSVTTTMTARGVGWRLS